jgi:hypothetical protein
MVIMQLVYKISIYLHQRDLIKRASNVIRFLWTNKTFSERCKKVISEYSFNYFQFIKSWSNVGGPKLDEQKKFCASKFGFTYNCVVYFTPLVENPHFTYNYVQSLKLNFICVYRFYYLVCVYLSGGELLELRLLEKTARHFFIIARHRSTTVKCKSSIFFI